MYHFATHGSIFAINSDLIFRAKIRNTVVIGTAEDLYVK